MADVEEMANDTISMGDFVCQGACYAFISLVNI